MVFLGLVHHCLFCLPYIQQCLRGLPHKNAGRPKDEHKEDIGRYVSALDDFWHDIDEEGQSLCNKRPSRKELYDAVVKQFDIQPKTNLYGERSNPRETVRRAYNELKKARKNDLEELSQTIPEDAIPPK